MVHGIYMNTAPYGFADTLCMTHASPIALTAASLVCLLPASGLAQGLSPVQSSSAFHVRHLS